MKKLNTKKVVIVLSLLMCVASCSWIFPDSSKLSTLKDVYTEYSTARSENESLDSLTESKAAVVSLATDIIKKSDKNSKAYGQASLIRLLVEQDFTGKVVPSINLLELIKISDIDKEPIWFSASVYALVGNSLSKEGKFPAAKNFYEKVLTNKEVPVSIRVYTLSSYVNAALLVINEPNSLKLFLDKAETSAASLQMEDPSNPTIDLLLAEINSQSGDDTDACSYAKSAISQGLKDSRQLNSAKFIQKTSCTN